MFPFRTRNKLRFNGNATAFTRRFLERFECGCPCTRDRLLQIVHSGADASQAKCDVHGAGLAYSAPEDLLIGKAATV